jgi:ribose transport system substrate-binding protein
MMTKWLKPSLFASKAWPGLFLLVLIAASPLYPADAADTPRYLVGYAQDTMSNDWRAAQVRQLQQAFSKYPDIRFIYTDARGDATKQIKDIEDLAYQKVDVLITSPRDAILSTQAISRVYQSGIPVVLITRAIRSDHYTSLVAPNDRQIAKKAARYMADKMNHKGNILMLKGVPTATTAIARTEGFLDEISNYPGINVVAIRDANYLRADAIKAVESVISQGIQFDAIYAQSDSMASGARLALKKAGINTKELLIVGIDYISEAREAIRLGEQDASFLYPTSAQQTVETVVKILHGKQVNKRVEVDSLLITRENVNKVEPIF